MNTCTLIIGDDH